MTTYKELYNEHYCLYLKTYNELFNPKKYKKKKALVSVRIRCTGPDIFSWSNSISFTDEFGEHHNMVIFYIEHNAKLTLTMFMNLERYYETE